ncbi:MAG: phosphoribosylanthranilate isomerase [Deltaproteobacteria bacterium]|nr:phosphoribosylanthranilate isomerase [Deltaproteobacteria bacterium]
MLKIKVCGLRDPQNIDDISRLQPDFVGFIFYEASPRFVGLRLNTAQLRNFDARVKKVGVFVNQSIEYIIDKKDVYFLDVVQLHGDEGPEFCRDLSREVPDLPVIKAFGVGPGFDLSELSAYESYCSWFLFDTQSAGFGGSGEAFDWDILKSYQGNNPFFVSGGMGRENIREVLGCLRGCEKFYGVDFNSKVEVRPGLKSISLVQEVMAEVRK